MLAFVLGGGGSRGALQVGALRALLEAGVQPDMLIGTSVGATNAAFVAADPTAAGLDRLQEVWLEMGDEPIFPGNIGLALLRFVRGRASLYPNDTMHQLLTRYLPVERFDELALPCYAIAMDLDNGEIVAFGDDESDRLVDGLMSSMALIPAHPPWEVGERRYVDGGFGAVLPVRHAIRRGATEIIALNLSTKLPEPNTVQSAYEIMVQTSDLMIRRQAKIDLIEAAKHVKLTVLDLQSDVDVSIDDFSYTEERIARGLEIAQGMLSSVA